MIWLFSHRVRGLSPWLCMWKHEAILNSQILFYSVGSTSYHGRYWSVNCNRDRDTHFVFNFIYFFILLNNICWRCKFSEYLDGNKTKQTLAEPTDKIPTYNALLYFPHTILLRGVYGESFFFEDHMGKESEDHMGTVPVEDYMGKGPFEPRINCINVSIASSTIISINSSTAPDACSAYNEVKCHSWYCWKF